MTVHELKCLDEFMEDIAIGTKKFEVRKNDRDYKIGDVLLLRGWHNSFGQNKRAIEAEVTYILKGGEWGIELGFVVMGIKVRNHNL